MKFKTLIFLNLTFASIFCVDANIPIYGDEITDSNTQKNPTTVDTLVPSNSSQLLMSQENLSPETQNNTENVIPPLEEIKPVEYTLTPLQLFPFEPMTVETANILPVGAIYTNYGTLVFPKGSQGKGTGLQVYTLTINGGVTDKLQVGVTLSFFDDLLGSKFNGKPTDLGYFSLAPNVKYQLMKKDNYSLAIVGSLEWLKISSENGLFTSKNNFQTDNTFAGTIQVPFTYNVAKNYQWHIVGGLSFFPDTVNDGGDFYGTFFNIGTGLSFKFNERFGFFADINVPLGPGGNSVGTNGKVGKSLVWSTGLNYLHSPTVGVDLSISNRLGDTPATKLLTFLPDGNQVGVGLNVRYTPDIGHNYQSSFDTRPFQPLSDRDKQLLFDGITLSSPNTIRQGTFSVNGGIGPSANFQIGYGMSNDAQLEFIGQQLGDSDKPIGNSLKLGAATKLRFLNQAQGDPFSFGIKGAFEEATTKDDGVGAFSGEASFIYEANDKIAFMFNPKLGVFGSNRILGAGFGINFQPISGLQLMGEVTPMLSNDATTWAAGARYMPPQTNVGVGVYGTNAAGTGNIGSVVTQSQDNVSVGFNIMWLLGK
ncbi:MAG: hypothetical protein GW795_08330 [Cyanobacteria bacterium]|nr:hypothetical protein [Cyanobacteria bacterium CG_2015-16_32_12]NCO77589.1 hypothetical protein [Cyanobacteria bacterium CG_2015-22_32_23]NCQ03113.1 hypothetical protein [Cyanobacteria bacterium CG_2015-09_32_10]NCQ41881.1 hypothetical protein [Cyanobacteria bacterium CG_2015-04_32_10]